MRFFFAILVWVVLVSGCGRAPRSLTRYEKDFPTPPPPGSFTVLRVSAQDAPDDWRFIEIMGGGHMLGYNPLHPFNSKTVACDCKWAREGHTPALVYTVYMKATTPPADVKSALETIRKGSDHVVPIVVYLVLADAGTPTA